MDKLIIKKLVTKIYPKQANGKYGQPQKVVDFVCSKDGGTGRAACIGIGKSEQEAVEDWKRVMGRVNSRCRT